MSAPRWVMALLRRVAPPDRAEDLLGDVAEVHRIRVGRHGPLIATVLTALEAVELAAALLREKARGWIAARRAASSGAASTGGRPPVWSRLSANVSWLDAKLGLRLLVKNPGLTLVAVFALAIGIPIGLVPLQMLSALSAPPPFDDGERIVGLQNWDIAASNDDRPSVHDFELWRSELRSFEQIAAFRPVLKNLAGQEGGVEPVRGSEITASAFSILRVRPLHGRVLVEGDEAAGAAPVVVLGYDLWQTRFGGDPAVVGRTVQLGGEHREVVGVMPPGFKFPSRRNRFWIPLQARGIDYEWGRGPSVFVFGRLADAVSVDQANAELAAIGLRAAAEHPETHETLRPEVLPLLQSISGLRPRFSVIFTMQSLALLLLAVACGNVGTLMLARAAARSGELAVRTALGASRSRIVMQLFVESLVLAGIAAAVGLGVADLLQRRLDPLWAGMPVWFDLGLTPKTVALGGALAVFSAVIAGVLPALKVTGRNLQQSLQRAAAGDPGMRFGILATVLIVAEVALAVGFLSVVWTVAPAALRDPDSQIPIAGKEFLAAQLVHPDQPPTIASAATHERDNQVRLAAMQDEIVRRLESEPGVLAVALGGALPGIDHDEVRVEVDGEDASSGSFRGHEVRTTVVDIGYFAGLGQPILAGRAFDSRDVAGGSNAVIVNRSFVERVLRGQNPIGRRIRIVGRPGQRPGPWYEIVGVVDDLGMNVADRQNAAGFYRPSARGTIQRPWLAVHVAGDPLSFAPRLRAIAAAVDPELIVREVAPLDQVSSENLFEARFAGFAFSALALMALVLSAAGLYALMSFTVSQRTYEIAVRAALGAGPRRLVRVVLVRAVVQLVAGVVLGAGVAAHMVAEFGADVGLVNRWPVVLATVATVMIVIGLFACTAPTLRALRIQPIQALRERA